MEKGVEAGAVVRRHALTAFAIVVPLSACANSERRRADSAASITPQALEQAAPTIAGPVTEQGIGALRAGMSIAEARSVLRTFDVPKGAETSGCAYATAVGLPAGVSVMVEDGIVGRIDIDTSLVPTAEGARVGDSEESIRTLYGKRLTVSPHKYTDGHYLTVKPSSARDTLHRLIFETNKGRVVNYRAGRLPQVEYVERCS